MRWSSKRDGAVTIYNDADTNDDMLVVGPVVVAFAPARRRTCDAALGHRHAIDGTVEVYCLACHVVHARFTLGTVVR